MTDTIKITKPTVLDQLSYDRSGVIEASAGTGKTYTIEHMVVDLILEEGVPISNILVVTFTERATSELVSRVRTILRSMLLADEDDLGDPDDPHWEIDDEARKSLREALLSFDRAPVYTIHGFCNRILSQHAFPNQRPFDQDQIDSNELFERIFPDVLRSVFAHDVDYAPILRAYIADESLSDLKDDIRDCTGTWEEIRPSISKEQIATFEENLVSFEEDFDTNADRIESAVNSGEVHGRSADKIMRVLDDFRAAVKAYRETPSIWTFLGTLNRVTSDDPLDYFVDSRGDKDWMPDSFVTPLRPLHENEVDPQAAVVNLFADKVENRLSREKNEEGVYTYDDMLKMVADGLDGPSSSELIQTLRSEFQYAIIDEFQDTDPRQWEIFKTLFYDSGSSNPCYLIGDPKQAIYGFRGADVKTYQDATDTLAEDNETDNWVSLDTNFRSTPDLIQAYNRVLGPDDTGQFFDEDGRNSYEEPVSAGFEDRWFGRADDESDVASLVIPSLRDPSGEGVKVRSYERMLGHYYAEEIEELLNGDLVMSDEEGGNPRPLTGNDIFILVNKTKEADLMGRYLKNRDIPYSFYKEEGLFQSDEARHLFHVLQATMTPGDRSRRLRAWHTPFFDVNLRDLSDVDRITDEDHPLFQRLVQWNELAESGQIGQLLHTLLHDSGILRRSIYRYPGERSLSNYHQLGERLNQWWQDESLSAEELTARLGRFVRGDQKPGEEEEDTKHIESDRSAVQIMTMHKAKGLEAPVVFLYGGWGRGHYNSYTLYSEDADKRVKYFGSKRGPYYREIDQYQREEAERLLYVAMTRASGRLYCPYVKQENRSSNPGGRIGVLFDRLSDFLEPDQDDVSLEDDSNFRVEEPTVPDTFPPITEPAHPGGQDIGPPEDVEDWQDVSFGAYRADKQLFIESYSSVSRLDGSTSSQDDQQLFWEEKEPFSPFGNQGEQSLPAGPTFGLFVHTLFENMSFDRVSAYRDDGGFDGWSSDDKVRSILEVTRRQFDIDSTHDEPVLRLIWRSLTEDISAHQELIPGLSNVTNCKKEMEFWFPIPESDHPSLHDSWSVPSPGNQGSSRSLFSVEDGYIRGFIDLVFEWNDRLYIADWKTDSFETASDYQPRNLQSLVTDHYQPQLVFYTNALMRMIKRSGESLEDRFGGLFYFFVRGMALDQRSGDAGVYLYQPDPDQFDHVFEQTNNLISDHIRTRREMIKSD